jgi:glycosyltransferase involved in cell wall biosynthesis
MQDLMPTPTSLSLQPIKLSPLSEAPLVSVLMANYNYGKYVGDGIQSVFQQTYSKWELIICDDGSTDESINVIERFAKQDSRIRLITKSNGGHASALNAAFAACTGDVICLLDSDDLYHATKIERVVEGFRSHPDSGMIAHRVIRVDSERRKQGILPLMVSLPEGWCAPDMLANGGVLNPLPPTTGLSIRGEVAKLIFPVPAERPLHYAPDQVIMRLLPLLTKVAKIDDALAEYRLHGKNSFETAKISVAAIDRDIAINERLWELQRSFLSRLLLSSAALLTPFESSSYGLFLRYLRAKLGDDPDVRRYHREFVLDLQSRPETPLNRFWIASIYLPRFLFEAAANLVLRQNKLKQFLARLRS